MMKTKVKKMEVVSLDPITGKDPSSLSVAQLAERLAMERAVREQAFNNLREIHSNDIKNEKEARLIAEASVDKARQIQFNEYQRRLETLNHAHEAAIEQAKATVPRETFDKYVETSKTALDAALKAVTDVSVNRAIEVDRRLALLEQSKDTNEGRRAGALDMRTLLFALLGIGFTVINIIVAFVPHN